MLFGSFKRFTGALALTTSLCLFSIGAAQAADCKGMTEKKCSDSDSCTWVKGYKTKAGKEVAAYCRNKASKKKGMEKAKKMKDEKKSDMKKAKKEKE